MDESELGLPPDLSPDAQGIPDTIEGPPRLTSGEMADQAAAMPADQPRASYGRVTANEEVEGESLDERLEQEEPDTFRAPAEFPGRLFAPESEVGELDKTAEEVAFQAPEAGMGLTAEEAAMRVEDESRVWGANTDR